MRHRRRRRRRSTDGAFQTINITPFTDVLLVLLIIFLIAGSSLSPTGLDVKELSQEATVGAVGAEESDVETTLFVGPEGLLTTAVSGVVKTEVSLGSIPIGATINLTAESSTPVEAVIKVYDELLLREQKKVRLSAPQDSPSELQ